MWSSFYIHSSPENVYVTLPEEVIQSLDYPEDENGLFRFLS